ncbi:MAG: diguanylate cyclase [Pseudomonadota bacterium]
MHKLIKKTNKILLVDDVLANIKILSKALAHNDYTLIFSLNGKKALELAIKEKPDLILLDIMMPEMDGYEVCQHLKNNPLTKDIPIIFVTAKDSPKDEAYGLELGAIDYIAKPINVAVLNARVKTHLLLQDKEKQLLRLSMIDGLTGISNRYYLDQWLKQSWEQAKRFKQVISIIMIDIDFFKQYNDHYGHLQGDDCLKQVASCLSDNITRSSDLVARYGGEEFICILPATQQESAEKIAEKLRVQIEQLNIPHISSLIVKHISISLGVASTVPANGSSEKSLIELADKALYQAKKQGRNCVIVYQ